MSLTIFVQFEVVDPISTKLLETSTSNIHSCDPISTKLLEISTSNIHSCGHDAAQPNGSPSCSLRKVSSVYRQGIYFSMRGSSSGIAAIPWQWWISAGSPLRHRSQNRTVPVCFYYYQTTHDADQWYASSTTKLLMMLIGPCSFFATKLWGQIQSI